MITSPDIVAIELLREDSVLRVLHGGRVSVEALPGSPAVRVTLLPGPQPTSRWEWSAQVQLDVWADDQLEASELAASIRDRWPYQRGSFAGSWVSGTWVVSDPMALDDTSSKLARYSMILGLAVNADAQD
jgi:hypothetical protein